MKKLLFRVIPCFIMKLFCKIYPHYLYEETLSDLYHVWGRYRQINQKGGGGWWCPDQNIVQYVRWKLWEIKKQPRPLLLGPRVWCLPYFLIPRSKTHETTPDDPIECWSGKRPSKRRSLANDWLSCWRTIGTPRPSCRVCRTWWCSQTHSHAS